MTECFDPEQALDAAFGFHQAGDLPRAEAGYRRVLLAEPDHPDALNFLGLLLQDSGHYVESQSLLEQAVNQTPDFAEALTNLARVQQITGQTAAAAASATLAVAADPDLPQAHMLLGRARLDQKDYAGAEAALRAALRLQPTDIDSSIFLGAALCGSERLGEARQAYASAIQHDSARIETILRVAGAWLSSGIFGDAVAAYQQATMIDPASALAHAGLAFAYRGQQRPADSLDACRRALTLAPDRTDLRLLLGNNLAYLGQFDAAEAAIREALARDPDSVRARRDLASIGRLTAGSADAARLRAALADDSVPVEDRVVSAFGLGSALDRAGEYNQAFDAFALANQLVHTQQAVTGQLTQPAARRQMVDWLKATFSPDLLKSLDTYGSRSEDLVFIVGMPRSGTSLIEQIAASHPAVFGAGEQFFIGNLIERLNGGTAQQSPATWPPEQAFQEAQACLGQYRALAGDVRLIIDKLPDNVFFLGQIAILFPRARIIFCNRDARDTCLSSYFQHFGGDMAWCYDLAGCAARAQETARIVAHWHQTLPLHMLDIQYETLISDLEGQSRRLIDFLGLEWDPACLAFHENDRPVLTASTWQVRQPLYASSAGRWKHYRKRIAGLIFGLWGLIPPPEPEDWDQLLTDPAQALDVAMAHHRDGRMDAAKQIYDAILIRNPQNPSAHHLLGIWYLNHAKVPQSLSSLHRARDLQPENAKLQADLARAHVAANDFAAAAASAGIATEQDPLWSDGWCQLGHALLGLSDVQGAQAAMDRASALAPDSKAPLTGKALILAHQKQFQESEALWRMADKLYPCQDDIQEGLVQSLAEQGRYDESLVVCRQALTRNPNSAKLLMVLASIHMRARDVEQALAAVEAALNRDDTMVDGWLLFAYGHAMKGLHEDAARFYSKALALDPGNAAALTALINVAKAEASDDMLAAVVKIGGSASATATDRAAAAFLLANACEKRGDYDAAFDAFRTANTINRKSRSSFHPGTHGRELRALDAILRSCFTRQAVVAMTTFGSDSDVPTFIVGLPRSGTSLVEQIAASHPDVLGLGEKGDFMGALGAGIAPMLLGPMDQWDEAKIRAATRGFVDRLRTEGPVASRIIDKMPSNIRWLGHIATLLPNARIIVCRRDLRDILWSCYTHNFSEDGMAWTDTLQECADYARETECLMDLWNQVLPGRFHEVYYEDMIENLEGEARRLIDYLGLPWDPACLSFHKTERVVMTASHWQVRQPLYATSIGRWRPYRKHLGPLLEGLQGLVPEDD